MYGMYVYIIKKHVSSFLHENENNDCHHSFQYNGLHANILCAVFFIQIAYLHMYVHISGIMMLMEMDFAIFFKLFSIGTSSYNKIVYAFASDCNYIIPIEYLYIYVFAGDQK